MGKFFGIFSTSSEHDRSEEDPGRFTRFTQADDHELAVQDADEKFTRFTPQLTLARPSPVQRIAQNRAPDIGTKFTTPDVAPPQFSDADNLNSEAVIPLSIFSKALPQRFAEMQN